MNDDVKQLVRKHVLDWLIPPEFIPPDKWGEENISFARDIGARLPRLDLSQTPYLVEPLRSWDFSGRIRETTVVAPEQTGKSLTWIVGLLWSMTYKPCISLVCYPSDDLGVKINNEKLEPLMREIPALAAELAKPRSHRKDHYNFAGLKSYFMGAGSRVTSQSAMIRVADEVDDWVEHEGQVTNIDDMRKRARSFDESMLCKVCSPKGTASQSAIWREFQQSSRGYWHLRCLKCGGLTMRSCDIHNLQWDADGEMVDADSLRLVCPKCRHEHVQSDKVEMNARGAYVHKAPELADLRPGYQWGALASRWRTLSWDVIAMAQMEAGKTAEISRHVYLDNSIRGLPFKRRQATSAALSAIDAHRSAEVGELEGVFMSCDTQDDSIYWIVRGVDSKGASYLLGYGRARTWDELSEAYEAEYQGMQPKACLIDSGGHRGKEVMAWVQDTPGAWGYKGNSRIGARWKQSTEQHKLILANPNVYQGELLYYIYSQTDRGKDVYWYLPQDVGDEYVKQIAAVKPNNKVKGGNEYERWEAVDADHWFDCEKEWLVLLELAKKILKPDDWLLGKLDGIKKYRTRKKASSAGASGFATRW